MPVLALMLIVTASGLDPETEAVMGRRKPPAERRIRRHESASPPPDLTRCADLARTDPVAARKMAQGELARAHPFAAAQCTGLVESASGRWAQAAEAFRAAAMAAGPDKTSAASAWAQAGNAALAGGDAAGAKADLDKALSGNLADAGQQGETLVDRARANVALGQLPAARADLDHALGLIPSDPVAWLLSATLARRMDDLSLARTHIAKAVALAPANADAALEEGSIAALSDQPTVAEAAFRRVLRTAPDTPLAKQAEAYLRQLGVDPAVPSTSPPPTSPPSTSPPVAQANGVWP